MGYDAISTLTAAYNTVGTFAEPIFLAAMRVALHVRLYASPGD
jgi:hypothetical protein